MSQQASKRARAIARGRISRGLRATGKRYAHQAQHRAKVRGTPEGAHEHHVRSVRRITEDARRRKRESCGRYW